MCQSEDVPLQILTVIMWAHVRGLISTIKLSRGQHWTRLTEVDFVVRGTIIRDARCISCINRGDNLWYRIQKKAVSPRLHKVTEVGKIQAYR
jgi:hypothetical protein